MADPLPPNPFPFLTPSYARGQGSICRADTPYPSVSQESVPSLIDNLVTALYGQITKSVINRRVVWNIPCDPTTAPATILGVSRNTNEGLLCYIIRALGAAIPTGFVTLDGIQTLTNKTLTAPVINSPAINNLTATGALALPAGSITSAMIANGSIVDADISASAAIANGKLSGNPVSTNTASTIVLRDGTGNFSAGTITASLSGNADTASNAFAGSTLASLLPKAAANISAGGVVSGNIGTTITVPSYALGNFTVSCASITTTSVIIITPKTIGSYAAFVNSQSSGQCQIVTYSGTSASLQPFSIVIL